LVGVLNATVVAYTSFLFRVGGAPMFHSSYAKMSLNPTKDPVKRKKWGTLGVSGPGERRTYGIGVGRKTARHFFTSTM